MTIPTRPTGAVPDIATDATYTAPGELWDGQPTKTEWPIGLRGAGRRPGEPVWDNFENWLSHDVSRRLAGIDLATITNWPEPSQNLGLLAGSGTPNAASPLAWLPSYEIERLFAAPVNGDRIWESRDGGYSWAGSLPAIATADFKGIANRSASVMALYEDAGVPKVHRLDGGTNVWTASTITTAYDQITTTVVPDPYSAAYFVLGRRLSITDASMTMMSDAAPPVQTVLTPTSDGNNVPMLVAACGPTKVLAMKQERHVYSWPRSGTVVSNLGDIPGTGLPRSLTYDPEADRFILIVEDSGTTRCLVSTDGSTWTVRGATPIANVDVLIRASVQVGGVLVVAGEWRPGTQKVLAVTFDAGVSWALMPDPMVRHTTGAGGVTQTLSAVGNRLAATGYVGAGQQLAVYGLRGGPLR